MSDKITLTADIRTDMGKGASRRLRRLGEKIPAIIYGAQEVPQTLSLSVNELTKVMEAEAFYSQILDVVVAGNSQQAVVRDLQRHPASGRVQHIDFQRISAGKVMHVNVPLHFVNEELCIGFKFNDGTITHNLTEVEISCLPKDLPQFIEVDMENVDTGSSVHLSDLKLPQGVTIIALTYGEDRDIPVVSVIAKRGVAEGEIDLDATSGAVEGDEGSQDDSSDSADEGSE
ncbi:MAG: 50S ribosomal protein L25/general stress protein Ctc [Gammaproteobacteria bacterium]|nr:50S ribosomal protein L25/general stress protein Ctc [Gammaproteobacteria bacterium]